MAPLVNERHYEATMDEVWPVLKHIVGWKFKKVEFDELSKGATFKTGASGFTAGQNFEASLIPSGDGVLVRLSATANVASNLGNGRAQAKAAAWIYQNLSEIIMKERAKD